MDSSMASITQIKQQTTNRLDILNERVQCIALLWSQPGEARLHLIQVCRNVDSLICNPYSVKRSQRDKAQFIMYSQIFQRAGDDIASSTPTHSMDCRVKYKM